MYTVCPKCTLALAVAASDLRAGQGYVRCGRCTNVFNALLNLRDETETSPGLALDESATASFMPEPTPLPAEDRRARARTPAPEAQPGLDLDLSPPAMPAPPVDAEPAPVAELDLQVPEAAPDAVSLDLTVPDPSTDEAALDLVVESASADEPDLDIVFDPSEEHEILLGAAPFEATSPGASAGPEAGPEAEAESGPAPQPQPDATPILVATPAGAEPPMAAAPSTAAMPPAVEMAGPRRTSLPASGLTPQGPAPMTAEPPRTPLPASGLTPLHATRARFKPGAEFDDEEFRGTGTYETIVLQGDSILQTEEVLPEQEFDDRIAAVAHQLGADGPGLAGRGAGDDRSRGKGPAKVAQGVALGVARQDATTASGSWPLLEQPEDDAPEDKARAEAMAADIAAAVAGLGPSVPQRRPRWMLAAGVILAMLLGLQAAHHWRNRLATLPALNGPLTRTYAALGVTLAPEWDLAMYDLRLLGASADPQDTRVIHVRMTLASHATVAQALPVVRLRLIDRYGKPLSSGDLQPDQYLPPGLPPRAFLQPDQRIDSDVRVLDPTQQASSFELDVCLPRPGGGLHCAGDLSFAGGHS